MDKTPLKMFELAVSCIDTENLPKNQYRLSLKRLNFLLSLKYPTAISIVALKKPVKNMQKQAFFRNQRRTRKGFKFKSIVPIPYVEWTDYNDEVMIRISVVKLCLI